MRRNINVFKHAFFFQVQKLHVIQGSQCKLKQVKENLDIQILTVLLELASLSKSYNCLLFYYDFN
jgi:hypothetical protein